MLELGQLRLQKERAFRSGNRDESQNAGSAG